MADDVEELEKEQRAQGTRITIMEADLRNLLERAKSFVSREEFAPVKLLAYGLAGSVLCAVLGALLSIVVVRK